MVDSLTIILTAICTGIGISIGNSLYDVFLKDYFAKLKKAKKKIHKIASIKRPWLAALLNFFIWGTGYFYVAKKRFLAVLLLVVQLFIIGNLSLQGASITGSFEAINYSFFTFMISAYLAYDGFRLAKERNCMKC